MLRIAFTSPSQYAQREVAAEAFVLRGGQLEKQPDAEPVAFGGEADWEVESGRFARAECRGLVTCIFEEDGMPGERHGPLEGVAVEGGVLRSGQRVIARLQGNYWQSASSRRAWPRVRIVETAGKEARRR